MGRRPELEGSRALVPSDLDRLQIRGLGLSVLAGDAEQQVAPAAIELRLAPALVGLLRDREAVGHDGETLLYVAEPAVLLAEQAELQGQERVATGCRVGRHPRAHPRDPGLDVACL